jgi:hypothetical protein
MRSMVEGALRARAPAGSLRSPPLPHAGEDRRNFRF